LELILTGRLMSATEAVAQGVVNRVVASGELEVAAAALARSAATRFRPPRTTPTPA
jgi:enoyl-CoA hydratase/carnithine racemase